MTIVAIQNIRNRARLPENTKINNMMATQRTTKGITGHANIF